jgi:hypothetical protein
MAKQEPISSREIFGGALVLIVVLLIVLVVSFFGTAIVGRPLLACHFYIDSEVRPGVVTEATYKSIEYQDEHGASRLDRTRTIKIDNDQLISYVSGDSPKVQDEIVVYDSSLSTSSFAFSNEVDCVEFIFLIFFPEPSSATGRSIKIVVSGLVILIFGILVWQVSQRLRAFVSHFIMSRHGPIKVPLAGEAKVPRAPWWKILRFQSDRLQGTLKQLALAWLYLLAGAIVAANICTSYLNLLSHFQFGVVSFAYGLAVVACVLALYVAPYFYQQYRSIKKEKRSVWISLVRTTFGLYAFFKIASLTFASLPETKGGEATGFGDVLLELLKNLFK